MSTWAAFVGAGIAGWVKKGAAALGVGAITYTGFAVLRDQVSSAVTGALGGMSGSVYQVVALSGFIDAVGIWLGAMSVVVTLLSFKRLGALSS